MLETGKFATAIKVHAASISTVVMQGLSAKVVNNRLEGSVSAAIWCHNYLQAMHGTDPVDLTSSAERRHAVSVYSIYVSLAYLSHYFIIVQ